MAARHRHRPAPRHRPQILLLWLMSSSGCVGPGLLGDGTSVSLGTILHGALRRGAALAPSGEGYTIPGRWLDRDRRHGTDELVELVTRAARRVHRRVPGALLGVADMSRRGGGRISRHLTHTNGRDVDLLLYATNSRGAPAPPQRMIAFDRTGRARTPAGNAERTSPTQLDVPRTWALVRALITDPRVSVQWIFVAPHLERLLLAHARRTREPVDVIAEAASAMYLPPRSAPHDDHLHVRIFCSRADRRLGCSDRIPLYLLGRRREYRPPYRPPLRLSRVLRSVGHVLGEAARQHLLSPSQAGAAADRPAPIGRW